MRKFGEKWRNDVMMTSSMGQISQKKKSLPKLYHLHISRIRVQKTVSQKRFPAKRRNGTDSKVRKMRSYSINIYKQWTLRNRGAQIFCALGHYAAF